MYVLNGPSNLHHFLAISTSNYSSTSSWICGRMQEGYVLHGNYWLNFLLQLTFVQSGTDKDGTLGTSLPTSNVILMQATLTQHAEPMLVNATASGSGESSELVVKTASMDVQKILQVLFHSSLCINSQINLSIRPSRRMSWRCGSMTMISIHPLANTQKTVSSPCSFVCATTYYLFSLDLITLIVEDSVHK